MMQPQAYVGQQLGHYRLTRLLGSGGFADVYLGEHVHLLTQVAVKILHAHLGDTEIDPFLSEARMVASLQHPAIVRVLDFGVEHSLPYLVMDYAPNGSLRNRYPRSTVVPIVDVAAILIQVGSALQYAHDQRIIHRDIKPENMLLGRNFQVLLSDFGIAVISQTSHSAGTQNIAGTMAYMAPEQIQAHPRPASDQYALAVAAYEWLCGQRPFQGSYTEVAIKHTMMPPPPLSERIDLPYTLEQVILKALQKDPQQRFENILAFVQAFAQATQAQIDVSPLAPASWPDASNPYSGLTPVQYGLSSGQNVQPPPIGLPSDSSFSTLPLAYTIPPPTQHIQPSSYPVQAPLAVPLASQTPPSAGQGGRISPAPRSSTISRRSFIGGGVAGLLLAGGIGAWLYVEAAGRLPTINLNFSESVSPSGSTSGESASRSTSPVAQTGSPTKPLLTYTGHHNVVYTVSWSPDGASIASGSLDGVCQVWKADKGQQIFAAHTMLQPAISNDLVQSLVWSRHNPLRLATGFIDGTLQIFDIGNRQRISAFTQSYMTNGVLSWSPDEKYLAVCKSVTDPGVAIYEVATWNVVATYREHTDSVHAVAWSPDGKYIASGSQDTTIRIWEPFSGKTQLIYKEHSGDIASIDWSSDSTQVLSAAQDYVVRIWQREAGNTLHTHQYQPEAPMGKVRWSHNNQLVAAYPGTGSVDILDAQLNIKRSIQAGVTYDLSWSPDDTRLVTGNYNNIAQVWAVS